MIKILDEKIFNRIAAGEVVESPSSIVKELVENSIDAKAASIKIKISGGGIALISVVDDGVGISAKDMPTAFLPHATSKVKSLECLDAITSLGFRGEALPSIASVASVILTSKQKKDTMGYEVRYEYGKLKSKNEVGASNGTAVTVKGVFDKIPARKKFLKKPNIETNKITDLVKKLILANPDIAFNYIVDNKSVLLSDGKGLESAVFSIYGIDLENMTSFSDVAFGIKIRGYASKTSFTKHNKSYQTIIINNRVVENEELSYAIFLAYKDFLMTRRYPVFVLHIDIPFDLIDVNVHPNKMQVKFVDIKPLRKMVYRTFSGIATSSIESEIFGENPLGLLSSDNKACEQSKIFGDGYSSFDTITGNKSNLCAREQETVIDVPTRQSIMSAFYESQNFTDKSETVTYQTNYVATNFNTVSHQIDVSKFDVLSRIKIVGVILETYIVVEFAGDVYLIDQHAAHERITYDNIIKSIDEKNIQAQPLLIPHILVLSSSELVRLGELKTELANIGFDFNIKDSNAIFYSMPMMLSSLSIEKFISRLIENDNDKIKVSNILKETIARAACRASVKAGDTLQKEEIYSLIDNMIKNVKIPLCPHGRPIIIKLTKSKIESWFNRT